MTFEFRDLHRQYVAIKDEIDCRIQSVIDKASFIHGEEVSELEKLLAEYVGVKHCITCANGTDALELALMAWGIGEGDIVFVPDFTFFASGEVVSAVGAVPVFVDVDKETYNMSPCALERMIVQVESSKGRPRAVIAVDLFGQTADYNEIRKITDKYDLLLLEDGAQAFGSKSCGRRACSFGNISTTSFFPAKPFGCYGDGGAVFTDNDDWAELIRSYCVHGKGSNKYDNVRIGMNSRLDTIQAAVLLAKYNQFENYELNFIQELAVDYNSRLEGIVDIPVINEGNFSSWAQYTVKVRSNHEREKLVSDLKKAGIPTAVYYPKPMHSQLAFREYKYSDNNYPNANSLSSTVISLPFHPYMKENEVELIVKEIRKSIGR
ncbi:DegT/DnrJ/EryC1/StrS family aminotransferase [Butyrivibrio sp. YAB3001]|uniref:DegT/DnrJ/EryC1/StrS family aminotransferase n=1 Tax=Butyrivibrio sp. YAB3001 TaxID=1520812 RepID=UPI0008F637CE|nr:DegT/DnrJ/EryC1/StrS family aminotransferase [Butyrivibrio sp. YAB3001]SFC94359.1 dTDP-4-amino-4,6-dideoxygalactose transaminase [Butyrivibrio sp. YAB3001]